MFIGHYGIAFAAKSRAPRASLGILIIAVVRVSNAYGPPPPSETTVAWGALSAWLIPLFGWWVDRHRTPTTRAA